MGGGAADVEGLGASDGPPASGGGMRSTDSFPLDPQLLRDSARLAHGSVWVLDDGSIVGLPGSRTTSSDDAEDSGDEGVDDALPDLRRLNENLESRPCPVLRNGGAITRSSPPVTTALRTRAGRGQTERGWEGKKHRPAVRPSVRPRAPARARAREMGGGGWLARVGVAG